MNLITKLLSKLKPNSFNVDDIKSVTLGERDEKGFADVYVNGEKTNCRMLIFTPEQIEKFEQVKEIDHPDKYYNSKKPNIEKLKKINEIYKKNNK